MSDTVIIWQDCSMICPDKIKQKIENHINNSANTYKRWHIFVFEQMSAAVEEKIVGLNADHDDRSAANLVLFRDKPDEEMLSLLHLPVNGIASVYTLAQQTELVVNDITEFGCFIEANLQYLICDHLEKNHWSNERIQYLKLDPDKPGHILTNIEYNILQSILEGQTNTQIADTFHFAHSTVSVKISRMLKKINALDRTEAIRKAIQLGWVHSIRSAENFNWK